MPAHVYHNTIDFYETNSADRESHDRTSYTLYLMYTAKCVYSLRDCTIMPSIMTMRNERTQASDDDDEKTMKNVNMMEILIPC